MPKQTSTPEPEVAQSQEETWDDMVFPDDASPEEVDAAIRRVKHAIDPAKYVMDANKPIPTQSDIDGMVESAAQSSTAMIDLGTPEENEPKGRTRARNRLLMNGAQWRRDIIRQFMSEGITDCIKIFAEFFRNPELRSRWIDPLSDPWQTFVVDFKRISEEKVKEKDDPKSLRERKDIRVDRLSRQYRAFMAIAHDPKAPAAVKLKALEGAAKMEREISVMEKTINPTPGRGDLPTSSLNDDDDEELGGGGEYELPNVT